MQQSGIQISYPSALADGRTSSAVVGSMGSGEALSRLLSGSGLTYRFVTATMVTLETAPQAAQGTVQLGPVRVEGRGSAGTAVDAPVSEAGGVGPVGGIVARRTATGSKTDTPLIEIPQSVSVVSAEEMELLKPPSLIAALNYTAGVSLDVGHDSTGDGLVLRGFRALAYYGSLYRNGMKFTVNFFEGRQEPYGLERVEVLKGAASVLYGATAPGGIVNSVSKLPTLTPMREIIVDGGSFDRKQISADFSGALTSDGKWSARMTVVARDGGTNADHVKDNRLFFAPAITWRPSLDTSLTLLGYFQRDDTDYTYGVPTAAFLTPGPLGRPSRSSFYGEPAMGYQSDRYVAGYLFEHRLSDRLKLRHALNYYKANTRYDIVSVESIAADGRTASRYGQYRLDKADAITADTSLELRQDVGGMEHRVLIGTDYTYQYMSQFRQDFDIGSIDLYRPVYGGQATNIRPNNFGGISRTNRISVYAQDQIKIAERLNVVLGGRQEWSRMRDKPYFEQFLPVYPKVDERTDAFTWRAGLAYVDDSGLAPYLSYSTSYELTPGRDRQNARFKPTSGNQYEVGLRYQPTGANLSASIALYRLTQRNVLTPDPVDPTGTFSIQQGEVRSRGVEVEARAQLVQGLNVIGAYSYTDAKTTKSNVPGQAGRATDNVPRHQVSLWAGYDVQSGGLNGLSFGGGARHTSSKPQTVPVGPEKTPAVTVFDAMIAYNLTDEWRLAVNATNLFDKDYYITCNWSCFFGEPRRVIASLRYRW
ncbi:TonB-dependent siderophore receptor [Sphingobium sp. B12D2B]|uniref:TonB-dependent siderophore receptor n=1 Tax=Sphingobium sp. B12D2B TaxID=2940577 RepID=UPI002224BAB5|nr:TonB-dependent siderophore receptor [Sphingobium sp. B12D2B]MCW2349154.1 iron complex outermembrane receptor protein [Sphingobium sp. B12D2B]